MDENQINAELRALRGQLDAQRDLLIELMATMLREEVSDPLEKLMDRLIALLLHGRAIETTELGRQMREAWGELPESARDTAGAALLAKYARLEHAGMPPSDPPPAPGSGPTPAWFRGLIQGGKG